ncbi:MAG: TlpA family protein disulfide reductase [Acidobacteriota bacterium]|nr:TlpA family protein disulfide reductase [Acidobacteriota bacterium]MDQ5838511.1 TlpA family protein disulfide reductase [Acidobacteriota bacterium]
MRLRTHGTSSVPRTAAVLALAALLACAAGCDPDGASKKQAVAKEAATPAGAQAPRTNLPMPPVEPAHRAASSPAAPRGAWTQLDGRRAALSDFRGQVVVLDFWATYCPPCREEVPHLVRLQKQLGPRGFKVIGLNVGGEEDQPKIPDFVKQYGIQYQLGFPDDQTVGLFLAGDDSIPHTFVIDRQGRLVEDFVGYDEDAAAELEQAVTTALSSKTD